MSALVAPGAGERLGASTADQTHPYDRARFVLAASGLVMLTFVVVHMAGNLLAFAGSGAFNAYARSLREVGAPLVGEGVLLWAARIVLACALVLHLTAHGYLLLRKTPIQYLRAEPWYATLPLEWLLATGAIIFAFVIFHLAQLTIGATHPAFVPDDAYHNLVVALGFWPTSVAYIVAAVAVGAHLLPGFWTGMRSLGLIRPRTRALVNTLSVVIPLVLVVGMSSVPVAILTGVLR